MLMNTLKPYYVVKTTPTYSFIMKNIAESYTLPKIIYTRCVTKNANPIIKQLTMNDNS